VITVKVTPLHARPGTGSAERIKHEFMNVALRYAPVGAEWYAEV